jgi:ribosomal protein L30/L7E
MAQQTEPYKVLVAVKIRGEVNAQREARETLALLHLQHTNHAIMIDNRPAFLGMLQRAHSYITWGEASKETIALMLKERGKLMGGNPSLKKQLKPSVTTQLMHLQTRFTAVKLVNGKLAVCNHSSDPPTKEGYKGKLRKASVQAANQATAVRQSTISSNAWSK